MSTLLYYFPGLQGCPSGQVNKIPTECNLTTVLNDANWSTGYVNGFSDGTSGVVISIHPAIKSGGKESVAGFLPDKQKWCKVSNGDKVTHWIGFSLDERPTPADLIRPNPVDGDPVTLQRQEWIVPLVHAVTCTLPTKFKMTATGPICTVAEEYLSLMNDCARWFSMVLDNKPYNRNECFLMASRCLNVNYRVGAWEASADCLDLLTSNDTLEILTTALGFGAHRQEQELKKKGNTPHAG